MSKLSYQSDSETQENHENTPFMYLRRKRSKRSSRYWKYYEKCNTETATCRFCKSQIAYKSTVGNLGKHLMRMHEDQMEPADRTKSLIDDSDKRSSLLVFFDTHSESDTASCKACTKTVPDNHLKMSIHLNEHEEYDFDGKVEQSVLEKKDNYFAMRKKHRNKRSVAWTYFTVANKQRKLARCNLCRKIFAYSSSVSNLTKHLRRTHGDLELTAEIEPDNQTCGTDEENQSLEPVWTFFRCIDKTLKIAKCVICKKRVTYSDDCPELKSHLRKHHPDVDLENEDNIGKTFMITENGDLYEVDDQKREPLDIDDDSESSAIKIEDEAENIDYLDESALEDPISDVNSQKWEPRPKKHVRVNKRQKRQNIAELQTERNRLTEDDPMYHFGKYIASSLKKLPKQITNKLQLEFIKRIIEVQNVDTE